MANSTVYPYGTDGQLPSSVGIINDITTGGADKALSAEQGKIVGGQVHCLLYGIGESDFDVYQVETAQAVESSEGTRLRLIHTVSAGSYVSASCSLGKGVAVSIYDTLEKALKADSNYLETFAYSYVRAVSNVSSYDGFLVISLCKNDSSAFSAEEKEQFVAATKIVLGPANYQNETLKIDFSSDVASVYRHPQGSASLSSTGNRLSLIFPVDAGMYVTAKNLLGKGIDVNVWDSIDHALKYYVPASYMYQNFTPDSYTHDLVYGVVAHRGYLVVKHAKSDDSSFTDAEMESYISALSFSLSYGIADQTEVKTKLQILQDKQNEKQKLFLGQLLQKSMTSGGLEDSTVRVSTASVMVVPKESETLTFKLPDGYCVGIRSGNTASNLGNNNFWYYNDTAFKFSSSVHYFRLCFAKEEVNGSYPDITVAEVENLILTGEIAIYCDSDIDIVNQNREAEKYIKAAMRNFVTGASNNGSLTKLPIFAHTSDVHGDATRFNSFMDYCDYLGVDAALVTGDVVASEPVNSMQYINDCADSHKTDVLLCMGNHDALGLSVAQDQNEKIIGYLITKNAATTNQSEDYPTYYYKDYASKKIRVIALNLYETTHTSHNCNFTQAQCEWFISALASTPENYGVLVLFHSPEKMPQKSNDYQTFYQDIVNYSSLQVALYGNVFTKIIDAFIGKTSSSISYTSNGTSITVSADFTNVASGVEFIAFISGHLHVDRIGYSADTTYKQLNLNVCCGIAIYGSTYQYLANNSDMPRGCDGSTQDCFNIYAIDRAAKTVRIAKVGSNVSSDLKDRKFMEIPYAD